MTQLQEKTLEDQLAALADLTEHVARARQVIHQLPLLKDNGADAPAPLVLQAIDIAQASVEQLGEFVNGLERSYPTGAVITLKRDGYLCHASVLGNPSEDEVAAFITELKRSDEQLWQSAQLVSLLLGLASKWLAAGFVPPVVLHTLAESAPKIIALGMNLSGLQTRAQAAPSAGF